MRGVRRTSAALLVVAAALALALPVWAHAELVSTVPAAGATVPSGLWELSLTFTEPIGRGSQVVVYAEQFQPVAGVTNEVDDTKLRARFTTALGEGVYTVQWTAIGADGHPVEGSYQFAVSRAPGTGQGPLIIFITSLVGGILALGAVVLLARRSRR
jgi:methionine-rich copper-binding protein CopC